MPDARVFVFDMDGVLFRGEESVKGAPETLERLRTQTPSVSIFFLTNNSSQPRSVYVEKLTRLGMPCSEEEIVTSSSATAAYLTRHLKATGKTVLAVGGPGIRHELSRVGMVIRTAADFADADEARADFVVVGMDRDFNYHTLYAAQQAILHGAQFIATNRDGQYPVEHGRVIPGGGAIVAAIEACADTVPTVVGKPETLGLRIVLDAAGVAPEEAVMVGDRPDTDVLCGNRLGVPTTLVLTGVITEERAKELFEEDPQMTPTRIIHNLREL